MTLDAVEIDLGDAFEPGMGYVALSRVRRLNGLKLMNLNEMALKVHPKILEQDQVFKNRSAALVQYVHALSENEIVQCQRKTLIERFGGRAPKTTYKTSVKAKEGKVIPTKIAVLEMLKKGLSIELIATKCKVAIGTVMGHIEKLKSLKQIEHFHLSYLKNSLPQKDFDLIFGELKKSEEGKLKPIYDKFEGKYSYDSIRLVRLLLNSKT